MAREAEKFRGRQVMVGTLTFALTAKDETELKGRMAIEIVRLTDPFSEAAKLTREERAAAIRDLADGWTEGLKRKESAK